MTGRVAPRLPWRDADFVMVAATGLVGVVSIAGAWFGADGADTLSGQAAWLNLAFAGFVIFAVGNCLWLLRGRRAVGERRVALVSAEADTDELLEAPWSPADAGRDTTSTATLHLVRSAGMSRLHHRDCPLVAGKPVTPGAVGDGDPCGVCGS